ncbi:inter-alpha-trypsin inhibitor heavy chain H6 isoform X3 [Neoarius graeffei]|uniref:inter-alpha-trypsin inhibitor heavy chain H6 isoform X3 n=1 Tax=Neoarius graeffei TaxID=443677 RepID=UPI00298D4AEC|nr:inter-alpha-trypsin inhibitor heavy chain H6 isoform X3 [Neoarius graeffei]
MFLLALTEEREIEKFRVAVTVHPGVRMHFSLMYEELLTRRLGCYELALGLRPGQPVQNLSVDVSIAERTGISFIKVLPLRTSRLLTNTDQAEAEPPSTQVQQNLYCAHIHYNPSLQQQKTISPKGINADFVLQYDVEQRDLMGDIQVHNGYFVHYFSPRGLPVVSKDIIFVIDISGSMIGTKIKQTKAAISTILGDLREGDYFNLITFSDKVQIWKKARTVLATKQNIRDAKEFVKKIVADGWTNINAALLSAAQLIKSSSSPDSQLSSPRRVPMIIFLTDGEATVGVTAQEVILHNAQSAMGSVSLFALAFGDDADFTLLKRLALENRGIARMVYEDADAALQLKGFYDEVASPLLSDIKLSYLDTQAYDVTRALFPNYFQGSELVVTGKIKPDIQDLKVSLTASGTNQKVKVESDFVLAKLEVNETSTPLGCTRELHGISNFVHRLWAYYTIKECLMAKLNSSDPLAQRLLAEKATNLSLKYNFVTPVTSLVVVKPDIDEPNPTTVSTTTTTPKTVTTTTPSMTITPTQMSSTSKMTSSAEALIKKPGKPLKPSKPFLTKPLQPDLPIPGHPVNTSSPENNGAAASPKRTTTLPHNLSKTTSAPLLSKALTVPTSTVRNDAPNFLPINSTSTASPLLKSSVAMPNMAETTTPLSSKKHQVLPLEKPTFLSDTDNFATPDVPAVQSDFQKVPSSNASPEDPDQEINISTLVAASFAPMPGMTDAPSLWEATGILDVSTVILTKDADHVKNYDVSEYEPDYIIHYGSSSPYDTDIISSVGIFSSSVDGDPHFVVMLPKIHENLCFTVEGKANDVLRLLEDPVRGITVNGHLVLGPPKIGIEDHTRTFFDKISIRISKGGIRITLTRDSVVVKGEGLETLPTRQKGSVTLPGLKIVLDGHQRCWIELAKGVMFLVLIHRYSHPAYFQVEHLGFYIADGEGLSSLTQGLLGQFQHSTIEVVRKTDRHTALFHHGQISNNSTLALGLLRKGDKQIPVTLQNKTLKDTLTKRHLAQCWVVPKVEVERLLEQPYQRYVVGDL